MSRWIFSLLILMGLQASAAEYAFADGAIKGNIVVNPSKVSLQQPLNVQLTLTYPANAQFNSEKVIQNFFQHYSYLPFPFKLIQSNLSEPVKTQGDVSQTLTLTLDPLFPGQHQVSFSQIDFIQGEKKEKIFVATPAFTISVDALSQMDNTPLALPPVLLFKNNIPPSLSEESQDLLFSAKSLDRQKNDNQQMAVYKSFPWLEIFSLLLAGLFLRLALKWSFRQPSKPFDPLKAREEALKEAAALLDPAEGPVNKQRFSQLTALLKTYFSQKYAFKASSLTAEEFLEAMHAKHVLDTKAQDSLADFLHLSQKIKFGDYQVQKKDLEHSQQLVKDLL